ncbi:MAG: hypothetical protein KZQ58_07005 [gamma proteobacterium symbiont of Bathyaustriella thionipta]|nr:hypothetical protein [gamma proteobacterium symbiont of Bathyaustriella thionipta]
MAACLDCHHDRQQGFADGHLALSCTQCHAGDPDATQKKAAHQQLIAFPGDMDSAQQICGGCHADKVAGVTHSLMHTGAGIVSRTRQAFLETAHQTDNKLTTLGHSPADSLLRKQCASCHLGQKKTLHRLDATHDRGGGCLACHINQQNSATEVSLKSKST